MKKTIFTDRAPKTVRFYSQAMDLKKVVFCSGQIPLTPDGNLIEGGITEQTRQVMENLQEILQKTDLELENIVKTTVYLTDLNDFEVFNEVYGKYFEEKIPARSLVQVAGLPKDAKIEIEAIAMR